MGEIFVILSYAAGIIFVIVVFIVKLFKFRNKSHLPKN